MCVCINTHSAHKHTGETDHRPSTPQNPPKSSFIFMYGTHTQTRILSDRPSLDRPPHITQGSRTCMAHTLKHAFSLTVRLSTHPTNHPFKCNGRAQESGGAGPGGPALPLGALHAPGAAHQAGLYSIVSTTSDDGALWWMGRGCLPACDAFAFEEGGCDPCSHAMSVG